MAISYGLGIRLRRICASEEEYRKQRSELKQQLGRRGYSSKFILRQLARVDTLDRNDLLQQRKSKKKKNEKLLKLWDWVCNQRVKSLTPNDDRCNPELKYAQLWNRFGGVCGICGDARYPIPRAHERGGRYYAGTVVKTYQEGDVIEVTTSITANHRGWFEFRVCAYDDPKSEDLEHDDSGNFVEVSHDCLNKNVLKIANGGTRWFLPKPFKVGLYTVKVHLPEGLSCNNCLLQWKWNVANSWGKDPHGNSCIGCGEQEQFYACSDISILPRSGQRPMITWVPSQPRPDKPTVTKIPNVGPKQPKPENPKPRPERPRPHPPQPNPGGNTNKPREFPPIPQFTYPPKFTRPKLPPVPSGRTPAPPLYTPVQPHFPAWIPTQQPSWPWFTPRHENKETQTPKTSSSGGTPSHAITNSPTDKSTTTQTPTTEKLTTPFKFWNWLSNRFMPRSNTTELFATTTASPDAPWWVKLPKNNRVIQWWNILSKFRDKSKVTTTIVPLPWWVKKAKSTQDLLPKFLNEKGESVDGEKELNGISASASKDGPIAEELEQTLPVKIVKIRKRICTPVVSLIQQANMWVWCDVNCSNSDYCPKTHCICSS